MRPNHPLVFVVDDDGDVRVALPVASLVHADRREPVEHAWHAGFQPAGDPSGDVARGPPRDMQETAHGLPVGDRHQPRAFHLEVAREPDARLRPRNPRHHHAMHTAFHMRSRTHELDPIAAEVLVPLTPFAAPVVVFRAFAPAARATQRGLPAPDARHQDRSVAQRGIVDGHVLDDHALDVEQTFEYVLHKAFSVVLFLGRKTNLQETPLTPS